MNEENIKKLIEHLKGITALSFNVVGSFAVETDDFWGMEYSLIGHAVLASSQELFDKCYHDYCNEKRSSFSSEAAACLGLNSNQAKQLFFPGRIIDALAEVEDAIAVLENLLATGEVDWVGQIFISADHIIDAKTVEEAICILEDLFKTDQVD